MALTYIYTDQYLKDRVTEATENNAIEEIGKLGVTDTFYIEKMVINRTLMLTALECIADDDDMFSNKYKFYSKEYDRYYKDGLNSIDTTSSIFSIEIGRS